MWLQAGPATQQPRAGSNGGNRQHTQNSVSRHGGLGFSMKFVNFIVTDALETLVESVGHFSVPTSKFYVSLANKMSKSAVDTLKSHFSSPLTFEKMAHLHLIKTGQKLD